MIFNNSFTYSPVPCNQLYVVGVFSVLLLFSSILVNSLLLFTIFKNKCLQNPMNYLISCLAVNNILGVTSQSCITISNLFNCRFVYSYTACSILAFGFWFSIAMCNYIVTLISIQRYMLICKNKAPGKWNYVIGMAISSVICLVLSVSPSFGWSYYEYVEDRINCSVKYGVSDGNIFSFTAAVTLFIYFIPIGIMFITNYLVIRTVKKSSKRFITNAFEIKKTKKQRNLVNATIALIASNLISYTLFSVIGNIDIYDPSLLISVPVLNTIAYLVSRSAFLWTSLLYMLTNNDIRRNLWFFKVTVAPLSTQNQRN